MVIDGIKDKKFYDWRIRKKKYIKEKGYNMFIVYSGRNLGKTTNIYRAEFQHSISQYNNDIEPQCIGIIIRTEKSWQKIKNGFLDNLKSEPFNFPFVVEGTGIWYVRHFEKEDKEGNITNKYKRIFKLAQIFFLWSANTYKLMNFETYRCLIFDEMVPEYEGYIPQEISKFETMLSTFSRLYNDKYVVGICNNISDNSPYFDYIGVNVDNMITEGQTFINPIKKAIFEYAPLTDYVKEKQKNSSAGQILKGGKYYDMTQGKIMKTENYFILSTPSGQYHPNYNFFINREGFIINQYSKTEYWICRGTSKNVRSYFGDKISAAQEGRPWDFNSNDWVVNDFKSKLDKNHLWFDSVDTREIFLEFIRKNWN